MEAGVSMPEEAASRRLPAVSVVGFRVTSKPYPESPVTQDNGLLYHQSSTQIGENRL